MQYNEKDFLMSEPLRCSSCNDVLFITSENELFVPAIECKSCGVFNELNIQDEYFVFLTKHKGGYDAR